MKSIFEKHGLSSYPNIRRATMTLDELRELLLKTPRPVLLNGLTYDIENKRIGPGIYVVWLKRREYDASK